MVAHITKHCQMQTPKNFTLMDESKISPYSNLVFSHFSCKSQSCNSGQECKSPATLRVGLRSVPCGKFQIICGLFHPANPSFRMYAINELVPVYSKEA